MLARLQNAFALFALVVILSSSLYVWCILGFRAAQILVQVRVSFVRIRESLLAVDFRDLGFIDCVGRALIIDNGWGDDDDHFALLLYALFVGKEVFEQGD